MDGIREEILEELSAGRSRGYSRRCFAGLHVGDKSLTISSQNQVGAEVDLDGLTIDTDGPCHCPFEPGAATDLSGRNRLLNNKVATAHSLVEGPGVHNPTVAV